MKQDWLGNQVAVTADETITGINDFIEGFLGYENKAENILAAAENDPESCLAQAYSALFYMFLESKDAPDLARPYIEKAESMAANATRREQMNVVIIRAWVDGDISRVLKLSDELAEEFPRDLAIVKQAQYHHFNLGNAAGMLNVADKVLDHNQDIPYMHGLAAFGYEQCHLMSEAEASARKAIDMRLKEPWAHHALAHVMLTRGHIQEGVDFLTDVSETWVDLNSFMLTHNWWHLGLNYISQGRYEETLALYDKYVWGAWKEYSQDQVGAVSLLMRLEIAGVDVGDRWKDVGEYLKIRTDDFVQPFLTIQYLYGLAKAELPEADTLMENLRGFAAMAPALTREIWNDVAILACEGLLSHARGDYETAFRKMTNCLPRIFEAGGSHAQRALFYQVRLDSMIKTGRYVQAQQVLQGKHGRNPEEVPTNKALVDVYQQLGLPRQAAKVQAHLAESI